MGGFSAHTREKSRPLKGYRPRSARWRYKPLFGVCVCVVVNALHFFNQKHLLSQRGLLRPLRRGRRGATYTLGFLCAAVWIIFTPRTRGVCVLYVCKNRALFFCALQCVYCLCTARTRAVFACCPQSESKHTHKGTQIHPKFGCIKIFFSLYLSFTFCVAFTHI